MSDALLIAAVAAVVWVITSRGQGRLIGTLPHALPHPLPERPRAAQAPQLEAPSRPREVRRTMRVPSVATLTDNLAGALAPMLRRLDVRRAMRPTVLHDRRVLASAVVVAVSAFVWFVWPTPYRDLPLGAPGARIGAGFDVVALRQQRLTGRVDALVKGAGWVCLIGCHSAFASAGD